MEDNLILGYDLCEDYCKVSYYQAGNTEPTDLTFSDKENSYEIQTVICKKRGVDEWLIGQEAHQMAVNGEGIMVDKLLRLVLKKGTATIEGVCYSAKQLLSIFLRATLQRVYEQCIEQYRKDSKQNIFGDCCSKIACMVVTMQKLEEEVLHALTECLTEFGIRKESLHMNCHSESFLYFVLSQKRVMWSNLVTLFDLTYEGLHYYEISLAKGIQPNAIRVRHERMEEGFSLDILDNESGRNLADSIMLSCAKRLMNKKLISSIYLSGEGMKSCQEWAGSFLQFACNKRKVFYSNNLFAKGAVHAALDYMQNTSSYPYTFLCEGRIHSTISLEAVQRGSKRNIIITKAGSNWYDSHACFDLILDHTDAIQFKVTKAGEKTGQFMDVPLDSFPIRPNKTTRVRVTTRFHSEERMNVTIEDKGFGEFYPSSNKVIEKKFNIW